MSPKSRVLSLTCPVIVNDGGGRSHIVFPEEAPARPQKEAQKRRQRRKQAARSRMTNRKKP